ncbi:hypothetical protein BU26DRAFT_604161 [Trematosphaeria pertusa]|uniref:Uncharacterized protein n=1 Tax=Trematosphaeria pertusa TaxID=390896 RepID=A0A6A6IGY0_9PLEO|nr:uncharacterized protein BU26DRAFT_604161 [Trematosphaeria pertusa]KAF2249855.1 hypothetical protein BU26DRAFT_604161 [Trematosphaeria pertusa]
MISATRHRMSRSEKEENGTLESIPNPAPSSRPKGDPDYRKKKGRQASSKAQARTGPGQEQQVPANQGSETFLSPSQRDVASGGPTLLASIETDHLASPAVATPKKRGATAQSASNHNPEVLSPPRTDRRKSVAFTLDTKTVDGSSASDLFKKWAQEQKGASAEFTPAKLAQFVPPPKVHPANSIPPAQSPSTKEEKKAKTPDRKALKQTETGSPAPGKGAERSADKSKPPPGSASKSKKDPSLYLSYLTHVIERLKERCKATVEEIDAAGEQEASTMDDPEVRKAAKDEALQEQLSRQKKRRQLNANIKNMLNHPYLEGYIRRLKRQRAEALLYALNLAAPASIQRTNGAATQHATSTVSTARTQKTPRKRKSRTEVSSEESSSESSSSSSSSEESSSSSESEPESGERSESDSDRATETSAQEDESSDGQEDCSASGSDGEREDLRRGVPVDI